MIVQNAKKCTYHHMFYISALERDYKGASTPSNIASNRPVAGNSFYLNSGVQGGNIAGN